MRGSFTGATTDKTGMFEHAHGGTLFLDEIGDMPLATQAKLLRVLQNQEVQRVGSLTTRKVDVRVIAATNHDLRAAIARSVFERICTTVFRWWRLQFRRWPSAKKICRCWSAISSPGSQRNMERNPRTDASRADPAFAAFLAGQCTGTGKRPWPRLHDGYGRYDRHSGSPRSICVQSSVIGAYGGRFRFFRAGWAPLRSRSAC